MNSKQIIFKNDSKSLSICNRVRIFEGEKNVDCFEFMIPSTYNNIDLTKCDIVLVYVTPDGIEHNLLINDYKQSETYKEFNVYLIDIDERFTSIAGELKLYLKFTSSQNSKDIILETSSVTVDLDKVPSGESGITPEKQDVIDQILLRSQEALKTATQALDKANSVVEKANNGEFNGKDGIDGKDGYTPQKGIDYFDGDKGEPGKQGIQGEKGENGKDYVLTDQDKQEIAELSQKPWRLIQDIDVTEELGSLNITVNADGQPFEVDDIYVEMTNILGKNGSNLGIIPRENSTRPTTYVGGVVLANPISSTTKRHFFVTFTRYKGLNKYKIEVFGKNATAYNNAYTHILPSNSAVISDNYKIREIQIYFSAGNYITSGNIKIYGR